MLRAGVGAFSCELGGNAGFVAHLDEKGAPALLDQVFDGGAFGDFDAALRADVDVCDGVTIKDGLDLANGFLWVMVSGGGSDLTLVCLGERSAGEYQGFQEALSGGDEGLVFDFGDRGRLCLGGDVKVKHARKKGCEKGFHDDQA
ncbi:MAG: hypothetical protein M2R45_04658 [Verrucomicrobia subdivision 3 bacterium]|nr:hypothetical protein [Limisphaerales bacterium]